MNEKKEQAAQKWYRPPIDRDTLNSLMKRNNHKALVSYGLWFALLAATGYLAVSLYGSTWAIPAFLLYGTIFATANARWHESLHGTPFKTRFLNNLMFFIGATMCHRDIVLARWSHLNHHAYTIITDRDLEILDQRPIKIMDLLLDYIFLKNWYMMFSSMVLHALGRPSKLARQVVPESKYKKMFWAARASLGIHIAVVLSAIFTASWLPILLFTLPRFYGGVLVWLFVVLQHVGLAQDVWDHRLNTRSLELNPVLSFLYMNMESHVEHHFFPNVPFHALPRLHELCKPYMPHPYKGLREGYRELTAALPQLRRDPNYTIPRKLPPESTGGLPSGES
jgi:fatty acid desaturase